MYVYAFGQTAGMPLSRLLSLKTILNVSVWTRTEWMSVKKDFQRKKNWFISVFFPPTPNIIKRIVKQSFIAKTTVTSEIAQKSADRHRSVLQVYSASPSE